MKAIRLHHLEHLANRYDGARHVQVDEGGMVSCYVDTMPLTNRPGRICVGTIDEIDREIEHEDAQG